MNNNVERIISKGAPFELRAAKKLVAERWYISDTEVNKIAHRLARSAATHILLPDSWTGTMRYTHSYPGLLPNAYITALPEFTQPIDSTAVDTTAVSTIHRDSTPPPANDDSTKDGEKTTENFLVFHRQLIGGGIHDKSEMIDYFSSLNEVAVDFVSRAEGKVEDCVTAWNLPNELTDYDGVLTGSTTLAAEAAVQGVPTFLISKANRGFLDVLEPYPHFYQWRDDDLTGPAFVAVRDAWLASMRRCRIEGYSPILAETKSRLIELWGEPVA